MDYYECYAEFLKSFLKTTSPLTAVFDCSNGTAGLVLEKMLSENGEIVVLNGKPDGNFPAHGPDPWKGGALESLGAYVVRERMDMGAVFDADGDRAFFVDDKGRTLLPDHVAILIAENFHGPVALDVRMGFLAREYLQKEKRTIIDSRVGHFFIKRLMQAEKVPFAAELSGHYYFADFFYCDSGIFAAIQLMNQVMAIRKRGMRLSEWVDAQPRYFQSGEMNFNVKNKEAMMEMIFKTYEPRALRTSKLDGIKMEFEGGDQAFWFSVRPSNTEDFLRLNLEAKNKMVFDQELHRIATLIES